MDIFGRKINDSLWTKCITSFSLRDDFEDLTTNAIGNSPLSKFGNPITATSSISGWVNNNASNSAGATYNKIKLRQSLKVF